VLGNQFLSAIYRLGMDGSVTKVVGTACPCMTFIDPARPEYSAEYHRLHPAPATPNCGGSGVINTSTTTLAIRAIIYPVSIAYANIKMDINGWVQEVIGRMKDCDMVLIGTVQTSGVTFFDLTVLSEFSDKATFDSIDYRVTNIAPYKFGRETLFQAAGLKRVA